MRQHFETEISELYGRHCIEFLAVIYPDGLGPFYLRFDKPWHRFFLDAGVLFWREGDPLDPENDLDYEGQYRDLAAELGVVGVAIRSVVFKDNLFSMKFENGALLRIQDEVLGEPQIVEVRAGSAQSGESGTLRTTPRIPRKSDS